jgi:hypothetical protein
VLAGAEIYRQECASCHEPGGTWFGKAVPIETVGTDRTRFDTWAQEDADGANRVAEEMGVKRRHMVKNIGYVAAPLSGLWLKAPFMHNGGIANMSELLKPPHLRRPYFWRGCDLYDPVNMGFMSAFGRVEKLPDRQTTMTSDGKELPQANLYRGFVGDEASAACPTIWRQVASVPGDGNGGHDYGTWLDGAKKRQLFEYLKTK